MNDIGELKAELERVQKDRDELRQVAQLANKVRGDAMSELERVQKQCGVLRNALERLSGFGPRDIDETSLHGWVNTVASEALNEDDAGANYVSKEDVKPLAEAVEFLLGECDRRSWENSTDEWCPVPKALAIIRALDL